MGPRFQYKNIKSSFISAYSPSNISYENLYKHQDIFSGLILIT